MQLKGFISGAYTAQSTNIEAQRCVNLYPQMDESGTGKNVAALLSTPGLTLFCNIAARPVRGMLATSQGRLFVAIYTSLYEVTYSNGVATAAVRGTLNSSAGFVSMAENGRQVMVVDNANGYTYDLTANTLVQIVGFAGGLTVAFLDGVFVYNQPNSQVFWVTGDYSTATDPLYFASAEGSPDELVAILADHENLWLFGTNSTEVWYDAGGASFPFQRVSGGVIQTGLAAPRSAARVNNTMAWLGQDEFGQNVVWAANGYVPTRISTHAIEQTIQRYPKCSDATAFGFQQDGHTFYQINFPTGDQSWVYDFVTQLWHERAYTGTMGLERHRADFHAICFGKHIVADYARGTLYVMDPLALNDAGTSITRIRSTPYVSNELKNLFISRFQLDVQTGLGMDAGARTPQAVLSWSDDGGHKWSNEVAVSLGAIGQTRARAIWRRLGRTRERIFQVKVTDDCALALIDAFLDVSEGTS